MSEQDFSRARYNLVIVAGVILMVVSALLGTLFADYGIVFVFTLLGQHRGGGVRGPETFREKLGFEVE